MNPTIVLVHGAWAEGASFAPVVRELQAKGYKALVAPNPLRGVAQDAKSLLDFLGQRTNGPVVLAAHSYGGVVITAAALSHPEVKALVYIDAFAPDAGESAQALTNALPGSLLNADPTTVFDFVLPAKDAGQGDWDSYVQVEKFGSIFAASLAKDEQDVLAASQSPAALAAIGTPLSTEPAWKTIPSWFFIGTADQVIPAAQQRVMAARANGTVVESDAPHLSMLAKPQEVVAVIVAAANAVTVS